jgi:mRNA interferase RelE/StbE
MAREVTFTRTAAKALMRMPANQAVRVRAKIDQYADAPETLANNVTQLVGSDRLRLRVGDWRVIMTADLVVVAVIDIGPRGGIYG